MSNFQFSLFNHTPAGKRSLEDVIGIVGHQLIALGHKARWPKAEEERDVARNVFHLDAITSRVGMNIIVEGFNEKIVEMLANVHAQGARFICLATEEPVEGKGFNHGIQREMRERQEAFVLAAPYLDGILSLVPGKHVTDWYGQYAPTAAVELGYARTLVRQETQREPTYDFGFYGTLSPRRKRLLQKLGRACLNPRSVKVVADFSTQVSRDRAMQEAKVIVQVRKFDAMGLVSSSRCNTALCLGRPVVAEPHALAHPWDEVVKFAQTDDEFVGLALAVRAAWRGIHADQFARFRERFTPEFCLGEPLRAIGITASQQCAA